MFVTEPPNSKRQAGADKNLVDFGGRSALHPCAETDATEAMQEPGLSFKIRAPKGHMNIGILRSMISGIPPCVGP